MVKIEIGKSPTPAPNQTPAPINSGGSSPYVPPKNLPGTSPNTNPFTPQTPANAKSDTFVSGGGGGGSSPNVPQTTSQLNSAIAGKTPAQATGIYNKYITGIRKEAGTYGQNINPIVEQRLVNQIINQRDSNSNINKSNQLNSVIKQDLVQQPRELPFQKITRVIPETAGKLVKGFTGVLGISNTKLVAGNREIPLKQSIQTGTIVPYSVPYTKDVTSSLGDTSEQITKSITSIGQFAIPYIGQALFVGSLLEKPLLAPDQFKQEFIDNPISTSVAYGLGLIGLKGSITSTLTNIERRALIKNFENAKTLFVANADKDTLNVLSKIYIKGQGKPIITRSELSLLPGKVEDAKIALGKEVSFRKLNPKEIEVIRTNVAAVSNKLPERISLVRQLDNSNGNARIATEVKGYTPFQSTSFTQKELVATFNNKVLQKKELNDLQSALKSRILSVQEVKDAIRKNNIVGIVKPTEAENILKVIAGDPKLRIYKDGRLTYIIHPSIYGIVRVNNSIGDSVGGTVILKRLEAKAKQISELSAGLAAKSTREVKDKLLNKEVGRLNLKVKSVEEPLILKRAFGLSKGLTKLKIQEQRSILPSRLKSVQLIETKQNQGEKINIKSSLSLNSKQETSQKEQTKLITAPLLKVSPNEKSNQRQNNRFGTKLQTKQRYKSEFNVPLKVNIKIPLRLKSAPFLTESYIPKQKFHTGLRVPPSKFDVYLKTGKKQFQRLNALPLTKTGAFGLGAKKADTSLKASFFIRKSYRPGFQRNLLLENEAMNRAFKFAPSKRTPGLIVEKSKFRLEKHGNTPETRLINLARRAKAYKPFGRR